MVCYNSNMADSLRIYSIDEIRQVLGEQKDFFAQRFFANAFFLFGSYAKNMQTAQSDIDLLVEFSEPIDMFDFVELQEYLSRLFNKKVDLGTKNSLKSFVRESVLKELIAL